MKACTTGKTSVMSSASESFPEIHTERCRLRKIVAADQPKIFEGLSNPAVTRYYGVSYDTLEATAAQMAFYEKLLQDGTGIWWAVCLEDTGSFAGACGFNHLVAENRKAEIGFWLLPEFQQRGYMGEIIPHVLEHGFSSLDLNRVEAVIETGNESSRALVRKLGFTFEGTLRECELKNGRFIDLEYYALLRKDWKG